MYRSVHNAFAAQVQFTPMKPLFLGLIFHDEGQNEKLFLPQGLKTLTDLYTLSAQFTDLYTQRI
ncbi:hypothetical protein [Ruegeria arenilitoris]|uniref:hypothetical protein n=1 Tax=Ruegeria arenilitoris TaxID=1173585 RepID=UPI001C2BA9F1|nr:hypothetical protein [Ruegeria arenilitoris]